MALKDLFSWKAFQERRAETFEVERWYRLNPNAGLAIIGGEISGNLIALDFDKASYFDLFKQECDKRGYALLLQKVINGYLEKSPKGYHLLFRSDTAIDGNLKMAVEPVFDQDGKPVMVNGKVQKIDTLIETRGEGGYVIVAPSAGRVHPSGQPYTLLSGGFDQIKTLTASEIEALLNVARSFDKMPKVATDTVKRAKPAFKAPQSGEAAGRPGDDFNRRADWNDILLPLGWVAVAGITLKVVRWTTGAARVNRTAFRLLPGVTRMAGAFTSGVAVPNFRSGKLIQSLRSIPS
jgi:hypothetical protein